VEGCHEIRSPQAPSRRRSPGRTWPRRTTSRCSASSRKVWSRAIRPPSCASPRRLSVTRSCAAIKHPRSCSPNGMREGRPVTSRPARLSAQRRPHRRSPSRIWRLLPRSRSASRDPARTRGGDQHSRTG